MAELDTTSDGVSPEAKEKAAEVLYWLNELNAAMKREKDFVKEGRRILDIYSGKKKNPFAILFSNTETMLPALYSAVPIPVVQRRFKDDDQLGKLSAQAAQRLLAFLLDTNIDEYDSFDQAMRASVLAGLLPGRGITAVKYESDVQDVVPDGKPEGTEPIPVKNWETVCPDAKPWDRFLHGYAKKWSKVPWVAYEMHLDRDAAEKAGIAAAVLAKIAFTKGEDSEEGDETETSKDESEKNTGERETALFYQIWDKEGGRKIRYICPQFKDDFAAVQDDPLGLTGFFNCPRPIQFVERVDDLLPVPLFCLYEEQAKELNDLTRRIGKLIKAIKARGAYDGELGDDIKRILDSEDGDLVPTDKGSSLAADKGLDNAIWMWPVEKLIVVLRELYVAREQCKQVIYEITGIADIMRGQSEASETLGAQEIKAHWGTLRLKRLQREVQRYARDLLRMMLDVAAHKFDERTWAQMTGLPFILTEEHQAAQQIAMLAQAMGQQPDQETQRKLAMPVWGEILKLLRDDLQRAYRIDIESNSTVEAEATEDKEMIAEVMNALSQFLNGVSPLVQSGALPFEAAKAMMLAIIRRFRFGPEIEDYVKAMKPPAPPDEAAAKAERERMQAEAALKQRESEQKLQQEREKHEREMAQKDRDAQHAERLALLEYQLKEKELNLKMRELDRKERFAEHQHNLKMEQMVAQVAAAKAMPKKKEGERAAA
jgi:hypothetical protein